MKKEIIIKQQKILSDAHGKFNQRLNSYAFYKVSDHDTSDDLVQETFIKTWKYLLRGGKIEIIKAFLFRVLNNLIVDEYRKRKTTSLDTLTESGFEPNADNSEVESLFNKIDSKVIYPLIQKLPESYRKILQMRYLQDLSLKEMSLITGQTRNALAVKVHRALSKLRILYNKKA